MSNTVHKLVRVDVNHLQVTAAVVNVALDEVVVAARSGVNGIVVTRASWVGSLGCVGGAADGDAAADGGA